MVNTDLLAAAALSETYIIAEIGQNHQGSLDHAKRLISSAASAGVNAVKSQKRHTRTLLTPEQYDRPYDSPNAFGSTYGEHRDALELSPSEHAELLAHASSLGIAYFVSPWDPVSVEEICKIGVSMWKVASASVTDEETVRAMVDTGLPLIMSTGMSTPDEILTCAEWIRSSKSSTRVMLHCTSTYPSRFDQLNLAHIPVMKRQYDDFIVGFSGHHRGISMDVAAVALGAQVLERHFTLDRTQRGSDHSASLEPPGLQRLVRDIRALESAIGDGIKQVYEDELPIRDKLRRSS